MAAKKKNPDIEVLAFWSPSCPECAKDHSILENIRRDNRVKVFDVHEDILEVVLFGVQTYPFYVVLVDGTPTVKTPRIRELI